MSSRTEEVLLALVAAIAAQAALPSPGIPAPARNQALPDSFAPFGSIAGVYLNVLDGAGEVLDATLGADHSDNPSGYQLVQRPVIEWLVEHADDAEREAAFDAGLLAIDAAIAADRTLGEVCSYVEFEGIERSNLATDGLPNIKAASITLAITFLSSRPF